MQSSFRIYSYQESAGQFLHRAYHRDMAERSKSNSLRVALIGAAGVVLAALVMGAWTYLASKKPEQDGSKSDVRKEATTQGPKSPITQGTQGDVKIEIR